MESPGVLASLFGTCVFFILYMFVFSTQFGNFIVESKAMVGETEVKERPKSNPDYLMQLMNDRKVMSSLPNFSGIFTHLERLLDEGKPASV